MDSQVSDAMKQERGRLIRELSDRNKRLYRAGFVGKRQRMLVERVEEPQGDAVARGLGEHYLPIRLSGVRVAPNSFLEVRIVALSDEAEPELIAEPV